MRVIVGVAMIASAMLALVLAAKPVPPPLVPVGQWTVRTEADKCSLERSYALGDQTFVLIFSPLLDVPRMSVSVVSPVVDSRYHEGKFSVGVSNTGSAYTGRYFSNVTAKDGRLTALMTDRRMLDDLKDGDTLHVQARPVNQSFNIIKPEKARSVLQQCIDQMKIKVPSIDPDPTAPKASLTGNPGEFFGANAYPAEALKNGVHGRVVTLLYIDVRGSVTDCRIASSVGAALNEGTCKAARRIRFKPARDAQGKPVSSTYVLPITWVLPTSANF